MQMWHLETWTRAGWYVADAAIAGAMVSLVSRGLRRAYRLWFCYLATLLSGDMILLTIPQGTNRYAIVYMVAGLVQVVLLAGAAHEWFGRCCEHYPGIERVGHWFLNIGLAIAAILILLTIQADAGGIDWSNPVLPLEYLIQRVVSSALAIFVFLFFGAWALYPVGIRRNLLRHAALLLVYLTVQSGIFFELNHSRLASTQLAGVVTEWANAFLFVVWTLALTWRGESYSKPKLSPAARVQLEAANEELLGKLRVSTRRV